MLLLFILASLFPSSHVSFLFLMTTSFLLLPVSPQLLSHAVHLFLHLTSNYWFVLSVLPFNALLFSLLSSNHSAHPGWRDHRKHHRGGAGPAGAHRGDLLFDEVPGGTPCLQPQCQVSARPVASGALPVGSVPGTWAEARAHPWHGHLRGQAGIAAAPWFDLVRCARFRFEVSQMERDNVSSLSFRFNLRTALHRSKARWLKVVKRRCLSG